MADNEIKGVLTTPDIKWNYFPPQDNSCKVLLLTRCGIATLGIWGTGNDVIAWSPLPKRDKKLERELGLQWPKTREY